MSKKIEKIHIYNNQYLPNDMYESDAAFLARKINEIIDVLNSPPASPKRRKPAEEGKEV